jgi:hypothetical protein
MQWTKEYLGISHLGKMSTTKLWVTVHNDKTKAKLIIWHPGKLSSPEEILYNSVKEAKEQGERIMLQSEKQQKKQTKEDFENFNKGLFNYNINKIIEYLKNRTNNKDNIIGFIDCLFNVENINYETYATLMNIINNNNYKNQIKKIESLVKG